MLKQAQTKMTHQSFVGNADLFKNTIYKICSNFESNEFNRDILNQIFLYASSKGNLDPNKGLWLWGEIGTGKSTLLKILAEYQREFGSGFKIVNCSILSTEYSANGINALSESTQNYTFGLLNPVERGFDELGREPNPAKYFGTDLNVMRFILASRYDLKIKTHISTNLKPEGIEILYGKYILDRTKEMFNFIEVTGESRRK